MNGDQDFGPFTLTYDETAGGYVLDWDGNSLPADPTSIELTWNLSADLEPLGKKLQVSLD